MPTSCLSESGPPADLDDAALVARCRAGDRHAWAALVRRYQRLVYTVPRRAGLSEADAADVFQFTFARLVEHVDRLDDATRVRAWLVTTARRETLRLLSRRDRVAADATAGGDADDDSDPLAQLPDPAPLPDAQLQALQDQDRVRRALERLDERSRAFVELLFLHDPPLAYAEIAARLGIAEGSIGPTRARCLDKLRRALQDL
ncbi:sigma-70 family RNA polymerase sigma factor [Calidifontimicrobium sp. SYSU G02091]|uniref:RNA polymerase sigma factor n=1 Tax=Azohydromonas TaxID=312063 RepID=UPI0013C2BB89|nr:MULTISPECIES: sigma-70 family RNA polymerase sigma factor [Azohydromonas]MCI1192228.1 sigma-70 family RNA polymerase sigma factor [Calidifontimicrobium sp. SYSU G02091]